jgi:hypothetical protein
MGAALWSPLRNNRRATMSNELKPCPFCGCSPGFGEVYDRDDGRYMSMRLTCSACDARLSACIPFGEFRKMEPGAIEAALKAQLATDWNRRVPDPDLARVTAERDALVFEREEFIKYAGTLSGDVAIGPIQLARRHIDELRKERDALLEPLAPFMDSIESQDPVAALKYALDELREQGIALAAMAKERDALASKLDAILTGDPMSVADRENLAMAGLRREVEKLRERYVIVRVPKDEIPEGARLVEAYETEKSIVVCGDPPEDDEDKPEELQHNCDEMGCCTMSHVIYRFPKTYRAEIAALTEERDALKRYVGRQMLTSDFRSADEMRDALNLACAERDALAALREAMWEVGRKVTNEREALRAELETAKARLAVAEKSCWQAEEEAESHAFDLSPAMVQARNDQLAAELETALALKDGAIAYAKEVDAMLEAAGAERDAYKTECGHLVAERDGALKVRHQVAKDVETLQNRISHLQGQLTQAQAALGKSDLREIGRITMLQEKQSELEATIEDRDRLAGILQRARKHIRPAPLTPGRNFAEEEQHDKLVSDIDAALAKLSEAKL